MRLGHRVHTSATAAQVWDLLARPAAWPQFMLLLGRVRGADGEAQTGHRLLGITRVASIGIPVDVVEAVRERRLILLISTAPGLREQVTFHVTPAVRGGCEIEVAVVVEGLLAPLGTLPLFLASTLGTRLLAARAEGSARRSRGVA